jgi:hypothetical protein
MIWNHFRLVPSRVLAAWFPSECVGNGGVLVGVQVVL